jgi:hypothetical protein
VEGETVTKPIKASVRVETERVRDGGFHFHNILSVYQANKVIQTHARPNLFFVASVY